MIKYTICKNKKSGKYSIRKEGYLFLSINGEWIKETAKNDNKIWETKKKRKAKLTKKHLLF